MSFVVFHVICDVILLALVVLSFFAHRAALKSAFEGIIESIVNILRPDIDSMQKEVNGTKALVLRHIIRDNTVFDQGFELTNTEKMEETENESVR